MTRRATLVLGGLALSGLTWWLWTGALLGTPRALPRAASRSTPELSGKITTGPASMPADAAAQSIPPASGEKAELAPGDYRAQLRASHDYLEFAQSVLSEAQAGDPAAQFYLSRALGYCESLYEWYFIERSGDGQPRHRTLDEAQQITAARPYFTPDDVRDIQARCQGLRSLDGLPFGSSLEWFDAALVQGYPLAQAYAAFTMAVQSGQRGDTAKGKTAREEARRLAADALRSRDTEVLVQLAGVAAALAGEGTPEAPVRRWSWLLAAAMRDENSEELREWMRMFCRTDLQCQPYETPADVIRRQAGNDRDEVERRARELDAKLESGELAATDID